MDLKVYNTKTRTKELFAPMKEGHIGMYVCGVTVYDMSHIGHARCYVAFDVIYRYLKHLGYDVNYIRNFTDVDDKIINRANEIGVPTRELAEQNIAEYHTDMDSLRCLRPSKEPRVTDHIEDIVKLVQQIVDNGHGYVAEDGSVYFSIDTYPQYLELSGRNLEDMVAGASDRVQVDTNKRNPLDFVLWKPSKEGEPSWDSPWSAGRPGWHIECSAMSARHLGNAFDIHGGGKDLVFPHHENEIAQSKAASGDEFARYWLHNGFVNIDQEKMSKSLDNFFTIREVLKAYHPEAVRSFLLSTHYRSPINYSPRNLEEATGRIEYMYQTLATLDDAISLGGNEGDNLHPETEAIRQQITAAMSDDFNAAAALGHLFDLMRAANEWTKKKRKLVGRITTLKAIREVVSEAASLFGILERPPQDVLAEVRECDIVRMGLDVAWIEGRLNARTTARKEKDFAQADVIREELAAKQVAVMDTPQGTSWGVIRANVE
jgi:cysteinyl-tRNA synthetase